MALSVNWITKVITVPQADLTLVSPGIYEHDLNAFRLELKDIEDGEGMPFLDTHRHTAPVVIAGVTIARVIEIINGYTVTYQNGQYAVNLVGANSNISDVANVNQVSIRSANTAGLIQVSSGSGLSSEQANQLTALFATLQSSGVFSVASLNNAWSATTRSLSSAGNSAIAAAVESQLSDEFAAIPANAWAYGSRTLTALPTGSALESSLQSVLAKVIDISDLSGYTAGQPMTANSTAGTISANGKTVTVTGTTTKTYTRS